MDPSFDTVMAYYTGYTGWTATEWLHDPYPPSTAYVPILNLVGGTPGVPNHFVIDRDGNVRWTRKGGVYADKTIITEVVDELI